MSFPRITEVTGHASLYPVTCKEIEVSTVGLAREGCLEVWIVAGYPEFIVISLVLLCVDLTVAYSGVMECQCHLCS